MAREKEDRSWLRLHIPRSLHEKLKERKKVQGIKSLHDLAIGAIERGLDISTGSRMMVRNLEEPDFVELSDYFKDSQSLTFVGKDLELFLKRYTQFLKGKMENNADLRFIVDGETDAEKVLQGVSNEHINIFPLVNKDAPPMNMLLEGFGAKMVVWFNLGTLRSPFFYFDDSSSQPAVKFMQYYHNIITRRT